MIEKLTEKEMVSPYKLADKINELIDTFNDHRHTVPVDSDPSSYNLTSVPVEE